MRQNGNDGKVHNATILSKYTYYNTSKVQKYQKKISTLVTASLGQVYAHAEFNWATMHEAMKQMEYIKLAKNRKI